MGKQRLITWQYTRRAWRKNKVKQKGENFKEVLHEQYENSTLRGSAL